MVSIALSVAFFKSISAYLLKVNRFFHHPPLAYPAQNALKENSSYKAPKTTKTSPEKPVRSSESVKSH